MSEPMKIFITGSNGFVGKALVPYLKSKNNEIIAATRDLYGDFSNQENWKQFLSGIEVVVHLAARVHVMNETATNPDSEFQKMNVEATLRLAKDAKAVGVKRFIFLSSVKVNGEKTQDEPYLASDEPKPEDAYGRSKAMAEKKLLKLHEPGIFEIVIIRPPLIYGNEVKANFQKLMSLVFRDVPLPFGRVNNRRSLCSVLNLCDLIATVIDHPKASGEIFLVRDLHDYSLKTMIEEIAKIKGKTPHLLPVPVSMMNLGLMILGKKSFAERMFGNLHVDITKNKELLNWTPPFNFQETFKK